MSHSTTIPIPETAFAHSTFTPETIEVLSKAAWAIILGRYAGSDIVVLEEHADDVESEQGPVIRELDLTSSRQLGSLLKQLRQLSSSESPRFKWENHGTSPYYSKIHSAGGSIADDASHVLLRIKDHSREISISGNTTEAFNADRMVSKTIACSITAERKLSTIDNHTSHHLETSHLVNIHVETVGSATGNQHHLRRISNHFQNVLRALIAKSNDKSESALKIPLARCFEISPGEIDEIVTWNQPISPPAHYGPIHYIIEEQAVRHADAPAIDAWDGQLTYAQLWQESSKLAQQLTSRGVVLETLVPFCFEKSAWAIVTMLGILKAGGAFVPLDPSWPRSRMEYIISKTQAKLMVTSRQMRPLCEGLVDDIFALDGFSRDTQPGLAPKVEVASNNLAYVLFTSGTTGQPKGVLIEHGNLSTSAMEIGKFAKMGPDTRCFQFTSYGFDAIFIETMSVLALGGCICVPPDSERLDDPVHGIQRMDVNTIFFTPSFLSTMQPETLAKTTKVHTVVTGGENLPVRMMETWRRHFHFVNGYGPTECCIITVMSNVTESTPAQGRIGRAISGKTWIVDHENDDVLTPIGAVGELLLQGPAVGRGYLDDAKKTAAVWADTSCFSWGHLSDAAKGTGHSGPERIYRTGDLVRYNSHGEIFYVGRKDTQVKLHGQRIELGEIEFHLRQHFVSPLQVIAEMITRPGPEGGSQVIAALIWTTDEPMRGIDNSDDNGGAEYNKLPELEPAVAELDKNLRKSLPRYMVPSVYLPVPHIPLTTSGKLDRRTLKKFAESPHARPFKMSSSPGTPTAIVQLTDMEMKLSRLWAKFLNIPESSTITPEDNFFHLGGNSIIAIKMVAAARQARLSLRVQDIFKSPTLSKMASLTNRLTDQSSGSLSALTQPVKPFSLLDETTTQKYDLVADAAKQCNVSAQLIEDILPCTPAQRFYMDSTTYFTDARERGPIGLSDHFIYRVRPDVDLFNLRAAWDKVALEYPILRTRIIRDPGVPGKMFQVVIHENEAEPLTWRHIFDANLDEFLTDDKQNHFSFGERLIRLALVYQPTPLDVSNMTAYGNGCTGNYGRPTDLVMSIQHSICDAWMIRLLFDEVDRVYRSIHDIKLGYFPLPPRKGENGLPLPATKFNNLLQYMRDLNHHDTDASARFWTEHLKDAVVKPFPSASRAVMPAHQQELNTIMTKTIRLAEATDGGSSKTQGITLSTSLYAALALLMGVYTSAPDVIFHLTRSGRDIALPGVEGIIAPTLTRHPLRIHVGATTTTTNSLDGASTTGKEAEEEARKVGDFLHAIQTDLSNMVDYQFLGWSEIRHLAGIDVGDMDVNGVLGCRSSYLVNLVPMEEADVDRALGSHVSNGTATVSSAGSNVVHSQATNGASGPRADKPSGGGQENGHGAATENSGTGNCHVNVRKKKKRPIHQLTAEGTFTPMPAGFYMAFVISADGKTVTATARYDGRVFKAGGVEKLLCGFERILGRIMGGVAGGAPPPSSLGQAHAVGLDTGGVKGAAATEKTVTANVTGEQHQNHGFGQGGLGERLADVRRWISGDSGSAELGPGLSLPSEGELYH